MRKDLEHEVLDLALEMVRELQNANECDVRNTEVWKELVRAVAAHDAARREASAPKRD